MKKRVVDVMSRFGRFTLGNGIVSLTINIVVNNTFTAVAASLIRSVVVPVITFVFNNRVGFGGVFLVLNSTPRNVTVACSTLGRTNIPMLTCNDFVAILVGFLVLTFVVFVVIGVIGGVHHTSRMRRITMRRPSRRIRLLHRVDTGLDGAGVIGWERVV